MFQKSPPLHPGFYDRATEQEWYWVDCLANTGFAESNWEGGARPVDDTGNMDCAVINATSGRYDHMECAQNRSYVCELTRRGE